MENKSYEYTHTVAYYETDKMGITHHSNYVRWLEEARTAFLNHFECGYAKFEAEGVVSPVLSVNCRYKHTTTFEDEVKITVCVEKYTGVVLGFRYVMKNAKNGTVVCEAESEHCFISPSGTPIIVRKKFPELDNILKGLVQE